MKKYSIYYILIGIAIILLIFIEINKPKQINWNKTFSSRDIIPFGNSALYKLIPGIFPKGTIDRYNIPYNELLYSEDSSATLLVFCDIFYLDETGLGSVLDFVSAGNEVFISAYDLSDNFKDTLNFKINPSKSSFDYIPVLQCNNEKATLDTSGLNKYLFTYKTISLTNHNAIILGKNHNDTNFVKIPFGSGAVYIHTEPLAFTNYYLLGGNTYKYSQEVLRNLKSSDYIYYDDYANYGRNESPNILRALTKFEALKYALYVFIGFMSLYLIFGAKRRQRIIEVITPHENNSVQFIDSLTNLYRNNSNHQVIAHHRGNWVKAQLNRKYHLSVSLTREDFGEKLASRNGMLPEKTLTLYDALKKIDSGHKISEPELHEFNQIIEDFISKLKHP